MLLDPCFGAYTSKSLVSKHQNWCLEAQQAFKMQVPIPEPVVSKRDFDTHRALRNLFRSMWLEISSFKTPKSMFKGTTRFQDTSPNSQADSIKTRF